MKQYKNYINIFFKSIHLITVLLFTITLCKFANAEERAIVSIAKYKNLVQTAEKKFKPTVEVIRIIGADLSSAILKQSNNSDWSLIISNPKINIDLSPELTAQRSSIFKSFEEQTINNGKQLNLVANNLVSKVRCKIDKIDKGLLIACMDLGDVGSAPAQVVRVVKESENSKEKEKTITKQVVKEAVPKIVESKAAVPVKSEVEKPKKQIDRQIERQPAKIMASSKSVNIPIKPTNKKVEKVPSRTINKEPDIEPITKFKQPTSITRNQEMTSLIDVKYVITENENKVYLPFSKAVNYSLSKLADIHYRLTVKNAKLEHEGLNLPVFAPRNFNGISAIKAFEGEDALIIDIRTDRKDTTIKAMPYKKGLVLNASN